MAPNDNNIELEKLKEHLRIHAAERNFVASYLVSGLAPQNNFSGILTPELFKKYFYVKRDEYENSINSVIRELFTDTNCNVMGLRAHGGSGKTIFINMLKTRIPTENNVEYINIDFESNSTETNKYAVVTGAILKRARKWLRALFDEKSTTQYQDAFFDYIDDVQQIFKEDDDFDEFIDIWNSICKELHNPENIEISNIIKQVIRPKSFGVIETATNQEGLIGIELACLILVLLIVAKPSDDNHYIIVFDNLEAITSRDLSDLPTVITKTWYFINKICTHLKVSFCNKITCIIAVRTTTNLFLNEPQYQSFWGVDDKYIVDLQYEDFSAEALLRKLKFLADDEYLKNSILYEKVHLICSMLCSQRTINEFLNEKELTEVDYKIFTKEKLAPFFGNNFRQLISHLCELLSNQDVFCRIKELLSLGEEESLYNITMNGIRGIMFNAIFKTFSQRDIFSYFGIDSISGRPTHSITRILLSFLYWDKIKFRLLNRGHIETYRGVSLKRIVDVFKFFYSGDEIREFARILYRLSPFHAYDATKTEKLAQWSYFITFSDIRSSISERKLYDIIQSYLTSGNCEFMDSHQENYNLDSIMLNLSEAGLCYVSSISYNFEFFNSRNRDLSTALFMFNNEKDNGFGTYKFDVVIRQNLCNLENFITGMIKNGKNSCYLYSNRKRKEDCILATQDKFAGYSSFGCSLYIRYLDVISCVIEFINYISRYRQFLWYKFKDVDADNVLLDLIEQYAKPLNDIRQGYSQNKDFCEIFNGRISTQDDSGLREYGLIRGPQKCFYYEYNQEDLIFRAIKYERDNHTGKNLYDICKDLVGEE